MSLIIDALFYSQLSFAGIELLVIIAPAITGGPLRAVKPLIVFTLILTGVYTIAIVTSLMFFNSEGLLEIPQPVLYFFRGIELTMLERLDFIFLAVWMVKVYITHTNYAFSALICLRGLWPKWNQTYPLLFFSALLFVASLYWTDDRKKLIVLGIWGEWEYLLAISGLLIVMILFSLSNRTRKPVSS